MKKFKSFLSNIKNESVENKILSAEEMEQSGQYDDYSSLAIDFARQHVRAAVRALISVENDRVSDPKVIDELTDNALKNFYPLNNIY